MPGTKGLVVGWGNPNRSDDGAAYEVVARLREALTGEREGAPTDVLISSSLPEPCGTTPAGVVVDALLLPQLGPEVAVLLADYGWVVFVAAHVDGEGAGSWAQPVSEADLTLPVSHCVGPGVVVAIARAMHGRVPTAHLLSVPGRTFNFGTSLSEGGVARAAEAAGWILQLAGGYTAPAGYRSGD